jgi:shikimate kinase
MKTNDRHVYLMGFMGCGKTRVGELLARRLCRPFVDTDGTIEREAGRSIEAIFADRGEREFRDMESNVIRCLSTTDGCVVSLGGGAVLRPENWEVITGSGITVTLSYPAEILAGRLESETNRPLLKGLSAAARLERIRSLLLEREPFYRRADLVLHLNRDLPAEGVAAMVAEFVKGIS